MYPSAIPSNGVFGFYVHLFMFVGMKYFLFVIGWILTVFSIIMYIQTWYYGPSSRDIEKVQIITSAFVMIAVSVYVLKTAKNWDKP